MELFIQVNEPKLGENAQIWTISYGPSGHIQNAFLTVHSPKNEQAYLDLLMNRRMNGQTGEGFYWYLKS